MASDAGKGDTPRPRSVSEEEYARRWVATFGDSRAEVADGTQAPVARTRGAGDDA